MKYSEIKKEIKNNLDFIFWCDKKGKILVKGRETSKTLKDVSKLKYDGLLYKLYLSFHTGDKVDQGGVIAINTVEYDKDGSEIKPTKNSDKSGKFWIKKDYLERNGWKELYIKVIGKKVSSKAFKYGFGIYNL